MSNIPPADVLENSIRQILLKKTAGRNREAADGDAGTAEKAESLRLLANELRLSGSLLQALETFRRAALLKPSDPWLLFEFARCLHSFAGSEGNSRLERKAVAMMRLSELRAGNDGDLLGTGLAKAISSMANGAVPGSLSARRSRSSVSSSDRSAAWLRSPSAMARSLMSYTISRSPAVSPKHRHSAGGHAARSNIFRVSTTTTSIWKWRSAASISSTPLTAGNA